MLGKRPPGALRGSRRQRCRATRERCSPALAWITTSTWPASTWASTCSTGSASPAAPSGHRWAGASRPREPVARLRPHRADRASGGRCALRRQGRAVAARLRARSGAQQCLTGEKCTRVLRAGSTAEVPTASSYASRDFAGADNQDVGDTEGRIVPGRSSAGGRKVAGSNPVAPTEGRRATRSPNRYRAAG